MVRAGLETSSRVVDDGVELRSLWSHVFHSHEKGYIVEFCALQFFAERRVIFSRYFNDYLLCNNLVSRGASSKCNSSLGESIQKIDKIN
jgi:hypothetical protein